MYAYWKAIRVIARWVASGYFSQKGYCGLLSYMPELLFPNCLPASQKGNLSCCQDCLNSPFFIFENLNSANPLINSDIWFYLLFCPSKKFRKCQFSAWNRILLRKNEKWDLRGALIISGLWFLEKAFFRKSPFLFRQAFHFRKFILR